MRISGALSPMHCDESDDVLDALAPERTRQQFRNFLYYQAPDKSVSEGDEEIIMRRRRLEACFMALLQEGRPCYQDKRMQVRRTGEGTLLWRLLTGPLQGCTMYVSWRASDIVIDFSAPRSLADRLQRLREGLEKHLNDVLKPQLITLKVTCESEYI
ncbi:MAG TPA: hypothetical protein VGL07_13435 [Buttiauxella sp.]|jgi:hypothetical protein